MQENEKEQTLSEDVSSQKEKTAFSEETSFGKFKDANALLKAYDSLQSEFTKRCQKIKELEQRISEFDNANAPKIENFTAAAPAGITEEEKEEILKGYLKQALQAKSRAILLDGEGAGLKTPQNKPKTVAEAGKLAVEILSKF